MLGSFAYAFNAVIPILALMTLGYWLKRAGIFNEDTLKRMNTFVFRCGLSVMIFFGRPVGNSGGSDAVYPGQHYVANAALYRRGQAGNQAP